MFRVGVYLISFLVFSSCLDNANQSTALNDSDQKNGLSPSHAKGFNIIQDQSDYIIEVFNPWQGAENVKYRYLLFSDEPRNADKVVDEVIKLPVSRIVCLSTTHIAYIDLLGESNTIVGISGSKYVTNNEVKDRINQQLVKDVGFEQNINYEVIMELNPQVVLTYGVGAEAAGYLHKFKDLRIPVMFIGDYLEDSPLGKAEWLKVFGILLGKNDLAHTLYSEIEEEYNSTKNIVAGVTKKPKVFINLPWNDVWYFPGGKGYMAKLIEDAGGDYLLKDLAGNQSYPYSIESALALGMDADVWINIGSYKSMDEVESIFPRLKLLPVFNGGLVYNNNKRLNDMGGNDFWESGVVNPHLILKDLVKIFYPDSIEHELVFYQHIK